MMDAEDRDDFQDSLAEMMKITPNPGLAYRLERAHLRIENTREASRSKKSALHSLMRILHPLLKKDRIFIDGYGKLVHEVKEMQEKRDYRDSAHYEDGLETLLNDVEVRKGLVGQKDIYDEPL